MYYSGLFHDDADGDGEVQEERTNGADGGSAAKGGRESMVSRQSRTSSMAMLPAALLRQRLLPLTSLPRTVHVQGGHALTGAWWSSRRPCHSS